MGLFEPAVPRHWWGRGEGRGGGWVLELLTPCEEQHLTSAGAPPCPEGCLVKGNCPMEPSRVEGVGSVPRAWFNRHSVNVHWVEWMNSRSWASLPCPSFPYVKWAWWMQWDEVCKWTFWTLNTPNKCQGFWWRSCLSLAIGKCQFSHWHAFIHFKNVRCSDEYGFWSRRLNKTIFMVNGKNTCYSSKLSWLSTRMLRISILRTTYSLQMRSPEMKRLAHSLVGN